MHTFHTLALLLVWYGICWKRQYPLTLQPPEAIMKAFSKLYGISLPEENYYIYVLYCALWLCSQFPYACKLRCIRYFRWPKWYSEKHNCEYRVPFSDSATFWWRDRALITNIFPSVSSVMTICWALALIWNHTLLIHITISFSTINYHHLGPHSVSVSISSVVDENGWKWMVVIENGW